MNYRQWKKNYKKKHGCNPPLEVDKRKQAKVARKALKQISLVDLEKIFSIQLLWLEFLLVYALLVNLVFLIF